MRGLKKYLYSLVIVPLILTAAVASIVYFQVLSLDSKLKGLLGNTIPSLTASADISNDLSVLDGLLHRAALGTPDEAADLALDVEAVQDRIAQSFERYNALKMEENADRLRQKISALWAGGKTDLETLVLLLKQKKNAEALKLIKEKFVTNEKQMKEELSNVDLNNSNILEKYKDNATQMLIIVLFAGIGGSALITLLWGGFIAKRLSRQLGKVNEVLVVGSAAIAGSSKEMARASEELAKTSQSQAESIHETAAAMTQIQRMVETSQNFANESSGLAGKSKSLSLETQKGIDDLLHIMSDLETSQSELHQVAKMIEEIGEKTQVIDDIVFQTKLLSFNASVEAARAAEQGRGFAIVAQEVGNLAQRSGVAADEISEIVKKTVIQAKVVLDMTIKTSKQGAEKCRKSARQVASVVESSDAIAKASEQIAKAAQEQTTGLAQIAEGVSQLNSSTQQNASSAQHSAAVADTLKKQVDHLNTSVEALERLVGAAPEVTEPTGKTELTSEQHSNSHAA